MNLTNENITFKNLINVIVTSLHNTAVEYEYLNQNKEALQYY